MKDSRTPWVTLLRLVLALSDAIVLEQIELLDFQKSQRLCMYLCVMDLNGYSMIWDPQWFDSLGHFLPSHRYAFCALSSFLLSILMPFTSPFRPHYLCPAGWSTGSMSEERRSCHHGRPRGGQKCRSGERRSRAQGLKVLRSDLWWRKEPIQVEWNIVQHLLTTIWTICNGDFGVSGSTKGNKDSVVAFMSAVLYVFVYCWTFGYECRHMTAKAFCVVSVFIH